MPRSRQFLLEQIARARRFAAAMNTEADRERFEKMAADYRSELDAVESAEGQSSTAPTPSEDAVQTNEPADVQSGTAISTAVESAATADGDQGPTTD
jgi:hypothetical protein